MKLIDLQLHIKSKKGIQICSNHPFESIRGLGKKKVGDIVDNSFENIKTISQLTPEVLNGEI